MSFSVAPPSIRYVAQLGPGVAAYNSVVGSKRLCQALDNAGIAMPCPPTPAMLDMLDRKVLCAIFCCCLESPNIASNGARRYQNCVAATSFFPAPLTPDAALMITESRRINFFLRSGTSASDGPVG